MNAQAQQKRSFKETIAVAFLKLAGHLPLSLSRGLGRVIGSIACRFDSRMVAITRTNIQVCLPHLSADEREQLVKRSVIETVTLMMEVPAVWQRDYRSWLKPKILKVEGRELVEHELAQGKGLILLAPHLGNWEVFGNYLTEIASVMVLYKPPAMAAIGEIMKAGREREGSIIVPTNSRGVARLLKHLKQGGATGILPDQVPETNGGEFAPFFGRPAYTMTLVHSLRARTDCRLLACYAQRVTGGFHLVFKSVDPDSYSDDMQTALTGLNKTVETCVLDVPEQYQWEYKRFRGYPRDGSVEKLY